MIRATKYFLFAGMLIVSCTTCIAQSYYPLAIGNRWDYQEIYDDFYGPYSATDTFSVVIVDTVTKPNGKTYFTFNDQCCPVNLADISCKFFDI